MGRPSSPQTQHNNNLVCNKNITKNGNSLNYFRPLKYIIYIVHSREFHAFLIKDIVCQCHEHKKHTPNLIYDKCPKHNFPPINLFFVGLLIYATNICFHKCQLTILRNTRLEIRELGKKFPSTTQPNNEINVLLYMMVPWL